jgi:hypothetical protein
VGGTQERGVKPVAVERPGSRSVRRAVIALICGLVVTPVGGLCLSRWYWGHWVSRPDLSSLVAEARSVQSLTHFVRSAEFGPLYDPRTIVATARTHPEYPYYFLIERVVASFLDRGLLDPVPPSAPIDAALLKELWPGNWLATASPGYRATVDRYIIAELIDRDGRRLLLLAVLQGQVSNDHFAYSELVFEQNTDGTRGQLLDQRRFYFDVAGMEGATWIGFAMMLAILTVPLSSCVALVFFVRAYRDCRRWRAGHCFRCNYDVSGLPATSNILKCPECGSLLARSGARAASG